MSSPVLNNSAFSDLDYFSSDATPLNLSLNSPPLGNSPMLSSPKVLGSPEVGLESIRRSIQFTKFHAVNWARPIQQEGPVRIFGASIQRNRRMRATGSPSSSSDDEPVTPPLNSSDNLELPGRTWSVVSSCKGLGMTGITEFDSDISEPELYSSASSSVDTESNGNASPASTPSRLLASPSRLLASSDTFTALCSPNSLEELKSLRLAAADLEFEARRSPTPKPEVKVERRIRRKVVPRLTEEELEIAAAGPGPSSSASFASRTQSLYSAPSSRGSSDTGSGRQSPDANPIVCIDSTYDEPTPRASFRETAALHSAVKSSPNRGGGFYKQTKAAMSALEFSPSTGRALGVTLGPRVKSTDLKSISISSPVLTASESSNSPLSSRPSSVRSNSSGSTRARPQSTIIHSELDRDCNAARNGVDALDLTESRRTLTGKSRKISKLFGSKV